MKYCRLTRSLLSWLHDGFIFAIRGKDIHLNVSCGAEALGFVNRLELPAMSGASLPPAISASLSSPGSSYKDMRGG